MTYIINTFFSFIEFLAGLSLADVLFRLPYENNKRLKHVLISLFLACESVYFITYWHNPLINFSFTLFLWIIALVVVFHISIWYSILIGIISALFGVMLEFIGFSIAGIIEPEPSKITRNIVLLAIASILYVVSVILGKRKFGFLIPNIYSKPPLNKLFFIVSLIMILSLVAIIVSSGYFAHTISLPHIIIVVVLLLCTLLAVYYSYQYNKKLLKDKYNRKGDKPWN
ncbi:hypothetical protein ACFQZT_31365 [Paenibacillus sp. GCM10027628]|uniref:hypothetical protein n=1 Tax=Paenibacillus sp. GCM10027628 TaxID=3273413 RepID=UPI0036251DCA